MSWQEKTEHKAHQRGIIEQAQHVAVRLYQTHMRLLAYRWFAPATALGLFAYHKSGSRLEKAKAVYDWMRYTVFGNDAMARKRVAVSHDGRFVECVRFDVPEAGPDGERGVRTFFFEEQMARADGERSCWWRRAQAVPVVAGRSSRSSSSRASSSSSSSSSSASSSASASSSSGASTHTMFWGGWQEKDGQQEWTARPTARDAVMNGRQLAASVLRAVGRDVGGVFVWDKAPRIAI